MQTFSLGFKIQSNLNFRMEVVQINPVLREEGAMSS
jgi:hypothetical protein